MPYSDLSNPQSLNLYEYTNNNPLSKADADGHWPATLTVPVIAETAKKFFLLNSVAAAATSPAGIGFAILLGSSRTTDDPTEDKWVNSRGQTSDTVPIDGGVKPSEIFATTLANQLKSGNKRTDIVQPDERAQGEHSVAKRNDNGRVTGYTIFDKNGNGLAVMRPDGKPHGGVNPSLVKEPAAGKGPGSPANRARPARPEEIPK